jgi:sporulation protein YlmC with PRC-barrel domain
MVIALYRMEVSCMAKQERAVPRDKLIGMQVIDAEGRMVGIVKDVAFLVGKMGISLSVENKKGEGRNVTWDEVQAVGDFVVLKPATQAATTAQPVQQQAAQPVCPTCKGPLSFIQQYQRWYCYKCQKYA